MRSNIATRRRNVSNERVLSLDELLPDRSNKYDSSPGVYVRADRDSELDILWQDYKVSSKEEKTPLAYLCMGFIAGVVGMLLLSAIFGFGRPSNDNLAELDLWEKANTKTTATATVSVSPSYEEPAPVRDTTAEYKVRNGDTLEKIAYRFYGNGSPSKISKIQVANNLRSRHHIRIGQRLVIPLED